MLEYRGYDSSGLVLNNDGLKIWKKTGKLENLETIVPRSAAGCTGLGHTRWATHGGVNDSNAHPHVSMNGHVAVVHNGIIDNYLELRERLVKAGYLFASETDSEVIAHLIEFHLKTNQNS
jgi:glucosamine--fructose-6-phosphate aminotransferase (isomerizing)